MLMSAHELEGERERAQVFGELARILRPNGRLVVAEFLRSPINLLVFGPGALHFRRKEEWLRILEAGRFRVTADRGITPFIRVFVASPPTS
jgi:ubiquinone/menaquinone biosynthesis C-methylase UbiE